MPQPSPIQSATFVRCIALLTCAVLCATTLSAQTSFGLLASGEFGSRTVGSALDGVSERVDSLRDNSGFLVTTGFGVIAERRFNRLFSGSLQLRYESGGYTFDGGAAATVDPVTGLPYGGIIDFPGTEDVHYRYRFLSLAIGATEVWGRGTVRFFAQEYLVPMLYLGEDVDYALQPPPRGQRLPPRRPRRRRRPNRLRRQHATPTRRHCQLPLHADLRRRRPARAPLRLRAAGVGVARLRGSGDA